MKQREDHIQLHPDLKPYYVETEFYSEIQHPLISSLPHLPEYTDSINQRYEKLKSYSQILYKKRRWQEYILLHQRKFRLEIFTKIAGVLTDTEYWELLSTVYQDAIHHYYYRNTWLLLFNAPRKNKQTLITKEAKSFISNLPDIITIYRGCAVDDHKGFSWTLNKNVAEWYTHVHFIEYKFQTVIYQATIKKSDIVCLFQPNLNNEVIIHPKNILTLRLVDKATNLTVIV